MNRFLSGVNITFRRDHESKRPASTNPRAAKTASNATQETTTPTLLDAASLMHGGEVHIPCRSRRHPLEARSGVRVGAFPALRTARGAAAPRSGASPAGSVWVHHPPSQVLGHVLEDGVIRLIMRHAQQVRTG